MTPPVTNLFIEQLKHHLPSFVPIIDLILLCSLPQRKAILTLTRCQIVPSYPHDTGSPHSYAYEHLSDVLTTPVTMKGHSESLHYFLHLSSSLFSTPCSSGLVNMLVRNLPLRRPEEYEAEVEKGIEKELSAAINKYHPASFNWDSLLHYCYQRRPNSIPMFHPDYPFHRETFKHISYGFHKSKGIFEKSLFYPLNGTKTIGKEAHKNTSRYHHLVQDMDMDQDKTTISDLELSKKWREADRKDLSSFIYSLLQIWD